MITDAPFALPASGLYMVRVGVTTLRTIRSPPLRLLDCSCQVQLSEPAATPGQMAKTPAASGVSGWGVCPKRPAAVARMIRIRIGLPYYSGHFRVGKQGCRRQRNYPNNRSMARGRDKRRRIARKKQAANVPKASPGDWQAGDLDALAGAPRKPTPHLNSGAIAIPEPLEVEVIAAGPLIYVR